MVDITSSDDLDSHFPLTEGATPTMRTNLPVLTGWFLLTALGATTASAQVQIPWMTNVPQAQQVAAQQQRLVLLHFWDDNCPPCRRLETDVFPQPQVVRSLTTNYVPVKVKVRDMPQLRRQYNVTSWPTDVITTPNGEEVFRAISSQDPDRYVSLLDRVAANHRVGVPGSTLAARGSSPVIQQTSAETYPPQTQASGSDFRQSGYPTQVDRSSQYSTQSPYAATPPNMYGSAGSGGQTIDSGSNYATADPASNQSVRPGGYGADTGGYGANTGGYGADTGTNGANTGGYGANTSGYGADTGTNGANTGGYGADTGGYGANTGGYGADTGTNGANTGGYGANTGGYGANTGGNGANTGGNAANTGGYGANTSGYGANTAGYGSDTGPIANRRFDNPQTVNPGAGTFAEDPRRQSPTFNQPPQDTMNPYLAGPSQDRSGGRFAPADAPGTTVSNPNIGADRMASLAQGQPTGPAGQAGIGSGQPGQSGQPAGQPAVALDGYCAVSLVEQQQWKKADPRWGAEHRDRIYLFAGPAEQQQFLANPDRYSPVLSGFDPVRFAETGTLVVGKRQHGVSFRNQIYLFAEEATLEKFWKSPDNYAATVYRAMQQSGERGPLRR